MDPKGIDLIKELIALQKQYAEAQSKHAADLMVLQCVCAALLGELALMHKHSREKLGQMLSSLQGVVHAVAVQSSPGAANLTLEVSRAMEYIADMTERAFPATSDEAP